MKVILTEEQLNFFKIYLAENNNDEASRTAPKAVATVAAKEAENVARFLYGDDYGKADDFLSQKYGVEITKDANIATGMFSLGNAKLSDDTLIINFTSALRCPSLALCPITQKACYAVAGENRLTDVKMQSIEYLVLHENILKDLMLKKQMVKIGIKNQYVLFVLTKQEASLVK